MMKAISLDYFRKRVQDVHPRTRRAHINTILGIVLKGGSVLTSFLLVPITIDYLSKETYGTWLTISSIINMMTLLDIGIGNGLRNKFSEAVSNYNTILARAYASTAYFIFGIIQLIIILIFSWVIQYIPWHQILKTDNTIEHLQVIIWLTVTAMSVKMVLDILSYILLALQKTGQVNLMTLLSNVFILIGTYLLSRYTAGNLIYLAVITAAIPIFILLVNSIVLYINQLKTYRPTIQLIKLRYARELFTLGYKFFFIQIAVLVLFYTDNLIVTHLFGPAQVTTYNIAFRYFSTANTIFLIAINPYWSAFTEAATKNDVDWMQHTYKYLQKLWFILIGVVIVMIVMAQLVYSLWIGGRVVIPTLLNIVMGISVIVICWNNVTVSIINGLGKIRIQLLCSLFAALVNVPLSFYLAHVLNLGSASVIIATCISLLPASITGTIQAKKLSNGSAHGIWAK